MAGDKPSLPRGYPLGALFLLVATCAVILALVTLLMREPERLEELVVPILISAAVGAFVLMLMGIFVGLFHFSRLHGIAWGILVGGLLGLFFGPILYISVSAFPHVLLTSLVGAILVVGTATVIRLMTGRAVGAAHTGAAERTVAVPKRHPLDPDPEDELGENPFAR